MEEKSENKTEDIIDFDIDASLLLAYELENLNLESIPSDIAESLNLLDKKESQDVILIKQENESHNLSSVEVNIDSLLLNKYEKCFPNDSSPTESEKNSKSVNIICDANNSSEDLNMNIKTEKNEDEIVKREVSDDDHDNINNLLNDLTVSDTNDDEKSGLRERAPHRTRRHLPNRQSKGSSNLSNIHDTSEFDHNRLLFLSAGEMLDFSSINLLQNKNFNSYVTLDLSLYNDTDAVAGDLLNTSISSPESGYVPSPPGSFSDSDINSPYQKDLDQIDEQNIIETLVELGDQLPLSRCNIGPVDNKKEASIKKLVTFLKDTEPKSADSSKKSNDIARHNVNEQQMSLSLLRNGSNVSAPVIQDSNHARVASRNRELACKPLDCSAKNVLRRSLNEEKYHAEQAKLLRRIQEDERNRREVSVIYVLEESETNRPKTQTNLHLAVLNCNLEEIYNIVEFHKKYNNPFSLINNRDASGKTALDYALEKPNMTDVVKYLQENTAKRSLEI